MGKGICQKVWNLSLSLGIIWNKKALSLSHTNTNNFKKNKKDSEKERIPFRRRTTYTCEAQHQHATPTKESFLQALILLLWVLFDGGVHVAQADLELSIQVRMTLNSSFLIIQVLGLQISTTMPNSH